MPAFFVWGSFSYGVPAVTVSIRPMQAADRQAVLGLLLELTSHEGSLSPQRTTGPAAAADCLADDTEKAAEHGGAQIVVQQGDDVVGYLALRLGRTGPFVHEPLRDHVYIENIVVAAACRGTGIGQTLLGEAERFARAAGCKVLHLSVLKDNELALNAYHRAGFETFAVEMAKILE
jgi:ribosomal protein S18 acetylase RimI-like enzyme